MRAAALASLTVLAGLLAGCLTQPGTTNPTTPGLPFVLDCAISPGAGGDAWPEPCLALASPNDSPSKAEVDLVVNPKDPSNVVVASKDKDPLASNDCVWSVAQVTKDGGKTWKTVYVGGPKANRVPEARPYECVTDPIMAFDNQGTLYYAMQIYDHTPRNPPGAPVVGTPDTGSAYILARSKDGGLTYDHYAYQDVGLGDFYLLDYPRMLVSPTSGAIHTIVNGYVGTPVPGNPLVSGNSVNAVVMSSRDGGQTVDKPVVLTSPDSAQTLAFFSGFAVTKSGTIYVTIQKAENSDAGETTTVWIWKSTDDARSFTEVGKAFQIHPTKRQHGEHEYRTPSFVEMAIDQSTAHPDRIYLFWPEWSETTQSDILTSWSDDGAKTWSAPVNIATKADRDQLFMRPRVGPDGTVHVLFATQAYSGGELLDQVHAWSMDGGAMWSNQRLTNVSFDADKGIHQDGFPFIGDYNGLAVAPDGSVHAAWGDTVTGRAELAYARILPSP
jgi:hypothetical protein